MLPGLSSILAGLGSSGALTAAYVTVLADTNNLTSYTFTGASIGTADATRYVAVAVKGVEDNPTSITVGGVSCTQLAGVDNASRSTSIWITSTAIAAGATADIVVDYNGVSQSNCEIGIFTVTGGVPSLYDSFTDTGTTLAGTADVAVGGCLLAISGSFNSTTRTWSGVTESYEGGTDSGALENITVAELNRAVSVTHASTNASDTMTCVSLQPA